jgi:glucosamine--fructose-6-phosphate aminotransferase (isomerizing)
MTQATTEGSGMSSRLEQEIREQGDVLRRRLEHDGDGAVRAARVLRDVDHLVIAARGTSDNVARYAQYLLGRDARLLVSLAAPSLYGDPNGAPRLGRAAVAAISQSGQSPDVVGVLAAARAQGRPTLALTNDVESPLAAQADVVIPLLAGPERSVAATKTYVASLFAIAQVAEALAPQPGRGAMLAQLPSLVDALVEEQLAGRERFQPLGDAAFITVTGRGLQYGTAHETALKIRELTGIPAEAFSPPDLVHGPIAAVGGAAAVWLVATERPVAADVGALWDRLRGRARTLVAVARDPEVLAAADVAVALPDVPDWAAAILAAVPAQAAALRLAEARGMDIDAPVGLEKVTRTT